MDIKNKVLCAMLALMLAGAMTACNPDKDAQTGSGDAASSVSTVSETDSAESDTDTASESDSDKKESDSDKKKDSSSKASSKEASSKAASSKAASSKAASSKAASSKAASSKAASSKATSSKEASSKADEAQNPVKKFEGDYVDGRATITVKAVGTREAEISVSWSSSASTYGSWTMSGKMDPDVSVIKYNNCTNKNIELNEEGNIVKEETVYENGSGRIVFLGDNQLSWEDDEENIADGMKFKLYTDSGDNTISDNNIGISKAEAISEVRQQAGSGAEIVNAYEGYTPEGIEAWVVTVIPVSKSDEYEQVTYYAGYLFCYAEKNESDSSSADNDGYISRETAIANVKQQAGSGAEILDAYKGYSPEGFEAWVITVAPVSADGDETVTYYAGYQFCYPE